MLTLTHSSARTLRSCPQRYYLEYEQRLRPERVAEPLRIGSAYHAARELDTEPVEIGLARIDELYSDVPGWCETADQIDRWLTERAVVSELYRGFRRFGAVDYEILSTEGAFSLSIPGRRGIRNAGMIDKIVRTRDGRIAVLEIKTAGEDISPGGDYWNKLRLDSQISRYLLAAQQLGYEASTVLYDVTRKPTIRPKKIAAKTVREIAETGGYFGQAVGPATRALAASGELRESPALFSLRLRSAIAEDPSRYYQRMEIPRLAADLEAFQGRLQADVEEIRWRRRRGAWQRNEFACTAMGRCPFLDICSNQIDVSESVPGGFQRLETPHPELSERKKDG